jgi:hypothetical protein
VLVRLIVTGSLLLALAACAGQAARTSSTDTASAAATQSDAAGTGSAAASSSLVASAPTAVPTLSASPAVSPGAAGEAPSEPPEGGDSTPQLILEAGGLGVVEDETRIEHLPFGTPASTIRNVVTHLVGPLTTTRRTDCGQGARTSSTVRGFELLFRGSSFVGWTDTGAKGRHLTTGDGIGVGVTVRSLLHSGTNVTIQRLQGGSEGEWSSRPAGLYGRSTSVAPTGRVTLVSSGETCVGD